MRPPPPQGPFVALTFAVGVVLGDDGLVVVRVRAVVQQRHVASGQVRLVVPSLTANGKRNVNTGPLALKGTVQWGGEYNYFAFSQHFVLQHRSGIFEKRDPRFDVLPENEE